MEDYLARFDADSDEEGAEFGEDQRSTDDEGPGALGALRSVCAMDRLLVTEVVSKFEAEKLIVRTGKLEQCSWSLRRIAALHRLRPRGRRGVGHPGDR